MKWGHFLIGCLLFVVSCSEQRHTKSQAEANALITLLIDYHGRRGQFPDSLDPIKEIDPNFKGTGCLWGAWAHSSDRTTFMIWTYPGISRRSLIYKCDPNSSDKTGWFTDDETGRGPVRFEKP